MRPCRVGVLAIAFLATIALRSSAGDGPAKLPDQAIKVLESAEQLELVSVEPGDGKVEKVLGSTVIKDAAKRREVLAALYKSVAEGKSPAKCFEPRHIIRATSGGTTVEIVICFQCDRLHLRLGKQDEPTVVPISGSAQTVLNKILTDAGIPLAK
jgi:hypothetical protein